MLSFFVFNLEDVREFRLGTRSPAFLSKEWEDAYVTLRLMPGARCVYDAVE